ncbi:MAG: WecB/TagA/CpsF family glycosyltransferase [Bacteroidota bacterium]|nr:WecB/TagA/CpsF family glycosyltransferase [Bacteroidota bacterium]
MNIEREHTDNTSTHTQPETPLHYVVEKAVPEKELHFSLRTFYLLGTRVDNIDGITVRKVVRHFVEENSGRTKKIFFTNVHSICVAQRDHVLKHCLNLGDMVLADGSGLKIGGRVMGHPITENLNGTDLTPEILKIAEELGWSVYLLGAKPPVVERCCMLLLQKLPRLRIVGFHPGYFNQEDESRVVEEINHAHPDILLVALGTPLQEIFVSRHAYELNAKVCMAVGGLFDFLSLNRKRAPLLFRKTGLEWLYRFLQEPKAKWERVVIEIPLFLSFIFAKRFFPRRLQQLVKERVFS